MVLTVPPPFRLGAFATLHGLESVPSGTELREPLRSSGWGDPRHRPSR